MKIIWFVSFLLAMFVTFASGHCGHNSHKKAECPEGYDKHEKGCTVSKPEDGDCPHHTNFDEEYNLCFFDKHHNMDGKCEECKKLGHKMHHGHNHGGRAHKRTYCPEGYDKHEKGCTVSKPEDGDCPHHTNFDAEYNLCFFDRHHNMDGKCEECKRLGHKMHHGHNHGGRAHKRTYCPEGYDKHEKGCTVSKPEDGDCPHHTNFDAEYNLCFFDRHHNMDGKCEECKRLGHNMHHGHKHNGHSHKRISCPEGYDKHEKGCTVSKPEDGDCPHHTNFDAEYNLCFFDRHHNMDGKCEECKRLGHNMHGHNSHERHTNDHEGHIHNHSHDHQH